MVRGVELAGVHALKGAGELASYAKAKGLGDCAVCATIAELCERCDAVALFTPNFARVENMEAIADAVRAGAEVKGVVCEKPLARTMTEARRLVELAEGAGLRTAYFENQVFMKSLTAALNRVAAAQSENGPLFLVRSAEEHGGPYEGWFWDPTRQGGGVLLDLGCHSISAAWYALTPVGKPPLYLEPVSISAETALLKWGRPENRRVLFERTGVDYAKTPAEDYAAGVVTFRNPESGDLVKAQFMNSWLYDKDSMRLLIEGLGPGYTIEVNTQKAPAEVYMGGGLQQIQPNEEDVGGYVDELQDACAAFAAGRDGFLDWNYGVEITKLCQGAYLSAERRRTLDLTDPAIQAELETYTSLIAQGRGADVLYR